MREYHQLPAPMTFKPFNSTTLHAVRARPGAIATVLAWLSVAILVFQLVGSTQHHHDLKSHYKDCVSCIHAAQLQSPPPDPVIASELVRSAVLQYVLPALATADTDRSTSKPVPRAQGPPPASAA